MNTYGWKDEYNVGCDYVDEAHRKLFSILRKTESLCRAADYEKNRFACIESIKYLKNYTQTHFAQEEAFMRQVRYDGYEMHKRLHDRLRDETIPQLEDKLAENDYSKETVTEFLGIFAGWLTSHIFIEDQAITGKAVKRSPNSDTVNELHALEREMERVLSGFTGMSVKVTDESFSGAEIKDAIYYEMEYDSVRVVFVAQNSLIFSMVGTILGMKVEKMDRDVLVAYIQMVHSFVKPALIFYAPGELEKNCNKKIINQAQLEAYFQNRPVCSVKWDAGDGGLAICMFSR